MSLNCKMLLIVDIGNIVDPWKYLGKNQGILFWKASINPKKYCTHKNWYIFFSFQDLVVTAIFTIFWLAGSSAWAQGVSDLKYYLHPETLFKLLPICIDDDDDNGHDCQTVEDGSYGTLNASLVSWIFSSLFLFISLNIQIELEIFIEKDHFQLIMHHNTFYPCLVNFSNCCCVLFY